MPSETSSSRPLNVLMLHGYTQSGALFHAKTRALEKNLLKAFPGTKLSYPTGPMRLESSDVPGFDASDNNSSDSHQRSESYGWWRRSNTSDPPEYIGLEGGLGVVAKILESEGPFDGVIGFSQGAALAAMTTSLLEGPTRRKAFEHFQSLYPALGIPYPPSFAALQHPPMKFCVAYAGFIAPGERYKGFYGHPKIQTPICHVLGSLDSVVDESRMRALLESCEEEQTNSKVVWHPGGHFVPSSKQYLDMLVEFIRSLTSPKNVDKKIADEENVEDMDVPF